jgi:hypothetical protein
MKDQDIEKYIGCCFDSDKFCELFPNLSKKLVKLTNSEECHNGLQLKTGFNEDFLTFNPMGICRPGGIYLTYEDNIPMWFENVNNNMKYCRKAELCYDSKIYVEVYNVFKVNKIFLGERVEIKDLPGWSDKEYCLKSLKLSAGNAPLQLNGCASLKFIKNIDEDIQIEALRNNWESLTYFLESGIILSEKVQMEAVIKYSFNFSVLLKYDILPSFEIQLFVAKKWGYMLIPLIEYLVKNEKCSSLSEKIVLEAIKNDGSAIIALCRYNLHISSEMKIVAVKIWGHPLEILLQYKIPITEEEQMLILRDNWKYIDIFEKYGVNLSDEAKRYANGWRRLLFPEKYINV